MGSRRNRFGFGGSRIRIPRPPVQPLGPPAGGADVAPISIRPAGPVSIGTGIVRARPRVDRSTLGTRRDILREPLTIMRVFQEFEDEDIVNNVAQRVTEGLFTGGTGSLTSFFTSSVQSGSTGNYYYNIYNENPQASDTEEIQFALAYGHVSGGGAPSLDVDDNSTLPTQGIYFQYRNILLDAGDDLFTFAGNFDSNDFYVITVQRARLKQKLDKGNWSIKLVGPGGAAGTTITLIDDSGDVLDTNVAEGGRVFNIVSGALDVGASTSSIHTAAENEPSGGYGLFYPDVGKLIFNPTMLSHSIGLVAETGSDELKNNHGKFLGTIQSGSDFQARSEENVTSTYFFIRVKNRDYNFSNNPSFVTGSVGEFLQQSFVGDPKTFVTTIGLYNDENELLAVAKLSAPLLKSFDRESLVQVKLDF